MTTRLSTLGQMALALVSAGLTGALSFSQALAAPATDGVIGGLPDQLPMHGQGSGFIIRRDGVTLTNAHVARDAKDVMVKLTDRREVVGINSQIYSHAGGHQGRSFAIPIDLETEIKDQIIATGHATHARLGVTTQEVNQALADSFKLDKPEGALVSNVDKGSPGDSAGLRTGDIIRRVNGQTIQRSGDLPAVIGSATPGEKLSLEIWRQGKREELTARLGDAGDTSTRLTHAEGEVTRDKLGLALRSLQPQEKRDTGLTHGLLIEDAGGPAALAGVQAGDVLIAVNGTPIKSVGQVRAMLAKADKSVALLIQRDGSRIFVPVPVG